MPMESNAAAGTAGQVQSEARGSHWVAWLADVPADRAPIVMVGQSQREAEERLMAWLRTRQDAGT